MVKFSKLAAATIAMVGLLSVPMSVGAQSVSADASVQPGSAALPLPGLPVLSPNIKSWCC